MRTDPTDLMEWFLAQEDTGCTYVQLEEEPARGMVHRGFLIGRSMPRSVLRLLNRDIQHTGRTLYSELVAQYLVDRQCDKESVTQITFQDIRGLVFIYAALVGVGLLLLFMAPNSHASDTQPPLKDAGDGTDLVMRKNQVYVLPRVNDDGPFDFHDGTHLQVTAC